MICHLQMRTPRLKLRTVACKLERGQADDLSVSKPQARPVSGFPFCRCANSIHLGSSLCQVRFLPQSFNLKVPGTVSSHCFQPLSEKFPPKSSERARVGRRNWKKAAASSCSVYPSMFPWVLARSCWLGYADQSGDTHFPGTWSGVEVLIIFSICL